MMDADTAGKVTRFPAMTMPAGLLPWIERVRGLMKSGSGDDGTLLLFRLVNQPRFHDDERFHAAEAQASILREGEARWRNALYHQAIGSFAHSQDMVTFRGAVARAARSLPGHGVRFVIEISADSAHLGTGDDERIHTLAMQVGPTDPRVAVGEVLANRLVAVAGDLAVGETMDIECLPGWPEAFDLPERAQRTIAHYTEHTWGDPAPIVQASRLADRSVALHMTSIGRTYGARVGERCLATILAVAPEPGQSRRSGELAL